jgi:hypothetical protein
MYFQCQYLQYHSQTFCDDCQLFLVCYSTPAPDPVDNWSYSLAAAPGIQLPANTFSRIGISYNVTTGQTRIKAPGIAAAGLTLAGSSTGTAPAEIDFLSFLTNSIVEQRDIFRVEKFFGLDLGTFLLPLHSH